MAKHPGQKDNTVLVSEARRFSHTLPPRYLEHDDSTDDGQINMALENIFVDFYFRQFSLFFFLFVLVQLLFL